MCRGVGRGERCVWGGGVGRGKRFMCGVGRGERFMCGDRERGTIYVWG